MPELSVIIPTYGAPELVVETLRSLAADDAEQDLAEIILVDDGSPNFDAEIFSGRSGQWPLTLLHLSGNRGRATARNAGIEAARGKTVIFLDGDMTVLPGFLAAHAQFHRCHPRHIAVGDIAWGPRIRANAMTRYIRARGVARYAAGEVPFKCFVTGNSSVPLVALKKAGGFDEAFVTYGGEDLELGCRLFQQGLRIHYLPAAACLHHQVRDFDAMTQAMTAYGRDCLPLLLARHPELRHTLRLGFLHRPWWQPQRLLLNLVLTSPVRTLARLLLRMAMPWHVPPILFDYLWWSQRTCGYLQGQRQ